MYAYGGNNPVRYIDPTGESFFWGPFTGSSIKWVGYKIHRTVQEMLKSTYGGNIEVTIPYAGRADYVYDGKEIYEVKPYTQLHLQNGKDQLQNYIDHSEFKAEKGIFLLPFIPKDIHIENLVLINTNRLKISCDVVCRTSFEPEQAGMIYYIPYNWKIENKSKISTSKLISLVIFGSVIADGVMSAGQTAAYVTNEAAAACLLLVPTPIFYYMNKNNIPDQI